MSQDNKDDLEDTLAAAKQAGAEGDDADIAADDAGASKLAQEISAEAPNKAGD